MTSPDVIIVGAGIVGAACARELARQGRRVFVLEAEMPGAGATSAGMGHVVAMEENDPEFALTLYSRELWREIAGALPREAEYQQRGTLWVAADEEEMHAARAKHARYTARGVQAELLDAPALSEAEPNLRPGLAGGLLVPEDAVTYPPVAARWLLEQAIDAGAEIRVGSHVTGLDDCGVTLASGEVVTAPVIVCAAGSASTRLLPWLPMRPRKGHLAITDRYPGFIRHQLVELGYLKSAHGASAESVAFNVQPRQTEQLLIGSSREFGVDTPEINHRLLSRMLCRATEYVPALAGLSVVRTWTGFRAATTDGHPLIGLAPGFEHVWLATGHEGLGITTSLGTARILADQLAGRVPAIDVSAFDPSRFPAEVSYA